MKHIKYIIASVILPSIAFAQLEIPKQGVTSELSTWVKAATGILAGSAAAIAVVIIVIGGIQYMTAQGEEGTGAAKSRIINGIVGLLIVALAYAIITFLVSSLKLGV